MVFQAVLIHPLASENTVIIPPLAVTPHRPDEPLEFIEYPTEISLTRNPVKPKPPQEWVLD
jgi:hypothetical protein